MHPFLRILIIFGTSICIFGCGFAWGMGCGQFKIHKVIIDLGYALFVHRRYMDDGTHEDTWELIKIS